MVAKKETKEKSEDWVESNPKEIENLIVELANAGNSKSEIGMILRDQHGIPSVKKATGKTIGDLLKDNKLDTELPEDLMDLIKRVVTIDKHYHENKNDMTAKHGYINTTSKIKRLVDYYKKKKILPKDWYFTIEKGQLLVK
ncbi:MAG: 30S ribosomal protein S15 [archaeon]